VSGTAAAAEAIGAGDVAGRLAPGRAADVLVVAGDPMRDLTALRHVLDVYRAGRRVERAER
jgi:imidazolonepropionase-like amidohydrolase